MTIGGFIKRTKEKQAKPKPFGRRLGPNHISLQQNFSEPLICFCHGKYPEENLVFEMFLLCLICERLSLRYIL